MINNMLKNFAHKRGSVSIEMLALLVVSLVVLAVIVIFFKGGLGEIGKKFGIESGRIKGQTPAVTANMTEAVETSAEYPDLSPCSNTGAMGCGNRGGACVTNVLCDGAGGKFFQGLPPLRGCDEAAGEGCCCT